MAAETDPLSTAEQAARDTRFWALVEESRAFDLSTEAQARRMIDALAALPVEEIVGFERFVGERVRDAFRADLWAVAYLMNGGCSDDGFDYFIGWLICRGRAFYEAALEDPENASRNIDPGEGPFENELVWYVARSAYEKKTGREDFHALTTTVVNRTLQGELFDEETVAELYPEVAKRFGAD